MFPIRQWAEDIGSGIRDLIGPQRGTVGADDLLDWQPCDVPDLEFACSAYLAVPQHDALLFLAVSHVQADVVFPDAVLHCADAIVGSDGDSWGDGDE